MTSTSTSDAPKASNANVNESSNPTHIHNCPKKRIIVACDGTWMDSDGVDQTPSNITRILRSIPPVGVDNSNPAQPKPITQVTFYQNGIGTGQTDLYYRTIGKFVSGATGEGLSNNIREAYNFICSNYHRDDEIILLGFSRGAFTARSISTLIKQLGLLTPKGLSHLVEICNDWEHQNVKGWRSQYSEEPWPDRPPFGTQEYKDKLHELQLTRSNIPVKAVAVWETVGALGIPTIALFPQPAAKEFAFVNTKVEDNIEHAFHALGLDERRRSYAPTIWFKPPEQKLPRVLKQTWFPGVHSDIGGSYQNDDIANLTLAWMVGQLEEYKLVTFNRDYLVRQVQRTLRMHEKAYAATTMSSPRTISRAKTFGVIRPWGLGKIHNSYTLFFRLGGSQIRTPMQHPEVSKATFKPTGRMLTGTHESMHASVRVRMALDGPGYDDKGDYISEALEGWAFEWQTYSDPDTPFQRSQPGEVGKRKGVEWVKTVGKASDGKPTEIRMPEDTMTEFERIVLRHWTSREDEWEKGANEREEIIYNARPKRRESHRNLESPTSMKPGPNGSRVPIQTSENSNSMQTVIEESAERTEEQGRKGSLHVSTNLPSSR